MEGAGTDFHIIRLHDDAAAFGPVTLKGKNEPLKSRDVFSFASQCQVPCVVLRVKKAKLYLLESSFALRIPVRSRRDL